MAVSKAKAKTTKKQPAQLISKSDNSRKLSPDIKTSDRARFTSVRNLLVRKNEAKESHGTTSPRPMTADSVMQFLPFLTALALVLSLLAAYAIGRASTSCAHTYASSVGTVKVINVATPKFQNPFGNLFSFFPYTSGVKKDSSLNKTSRAILVNPQGESLIINTNNVRSLAQYDNKNVILTGQVSPCTKSVTLDSLLNITPLFNATSPTGQ